MKVALEVDNHSITGWTRVKIHRSIYQVSGSFDLGVSLLGATPPKIEMGMACVVRIGTQALVTGWIDRTLESISKDDHVLSVSGRDKTCDLVDCSSTLKVRAWPNIYLDQIATNLLKEFGITHTGIPKTSSAPFLAWSIQEESVYDNLAKAAALRQFLLYTDGSGNLVIAKPNQSPPEISITGEILSVEEEINGQNRYSNYTTLMQNFSDDTNSVIKVVASQADPSVKRHRPIHIIQDHEIRKEVAENRLNWEISSRRGKSRRLTLSVPSWTDPNGSPWGINVPVSIDLLDGRFKGNYLISEVSFELDKSAQTATLTLQPVQSAVLDPTTQDSEISERKAIEADRRLADGQ